MRKSLPKVTFFYVKDNGAKISLICQKVTESIEQEKKLLIRVPNIESAQYIDSLLWRIPEESFLPHLIVQNPSQEHIAITMAENANLNEAHWLLNLSPQISTLYHQFEEIYELYDETHPQKIQQAQQKLKEYQLNGLVVIER